MLCIAAYLPISSFTVSDLWATHFFVLFPLPQLVVACAAVWFAELIFVTRFATMAAKPQAETAPINLQTRRSVPWSGALVATIALLLLAVPTIRDQWVNESYQAALNQTGGSGRFSDAIYALSSYFDQNAITQPIALDWGIAANVEVVSSGRVRPIEIFGFSQQPDDAFRARAREALANPTNTYVLLWGGDEKWPGFAVFNRRQEFTRLAAEAGNTIHEVFIAHERSGLPVYIVLTAGK